MNKVDVAQVLIHSTAIGGIGLLWFDFSKKVFRAVRNLLGVTLYYAGVELYYTDEETDSDTDAKTVADTDAKTD